MEIMRTVILYMQDSLTPKKRKKKDKECEHDDNDTNVSLVER